MPYPPITRFTHLLSQTILSRHITILSFRRSDRLSAEGRNMNSATHVLSPKTIKIKASCSSFGYSCLSNPEHKKSNKLARMLQGLRFHKIELQETIRRRCSSILYGDVDIVSLQKQEGGEEWRRESDSLSQTCWTREG